MANPLYNDLISLGFQPSQPLAIRDQLRLCEKGTTYLLKMDPRMGCCSYKVDGYVITSVATNKCDHVALVTYGNNWAEIFVELKGGGIAHGIKQLWSTINMIPFVSTQHTLRRARIVTQNRIPANTGNSILERAKVDFMKKGCELKAIKSLQPDLLKESDFLPRSIR